MIKSERVLFLIALAPPHNGADPPMKLLEIVLPFDPEPGIKLMVV